MIIIYVQEKNFFNHEKKTDKPKYFKNFMDHDHELCFESALKDFKQHFIEKNLVNTVTPKSIQIITKRSSASRCLSNSGLITKRWF